MVFLLGKARQVWQRNAHPYTSVLPKKETDAISSDEKVLRRIPGSKYDATLERPVHFSAFRPTDKDQDGLSVFRALFCTPDQLDEASWNPGTFLVAGLMATDIFGIELSLDPAPDSSQPGGHSLIPEVNILDYKAQKERMRETMFKLAELAAKDILYPRRKTSN